MIIEWKKVSILLQLIIAHTAHTLAITLAHTDQCTLHFTLLCHFLGSWHFSGVYSSCNNNNSICQQQVVVSGFVAGFVWLWLSCLFCTGFVCFQHAYALLCIRIISTLHSRLATRLRDLHTRNLLLISSRCDLPATAFQLKQIRY